MWLAQSSVTSMRTAIVDSHDIDVLQAGVQAGAIDAIFDLDGNQTVDSFDVAFLVQVMLETDFGDVNLDGTGRLR